jgi:hypothetical protein
MEVQLFDSCFILSVARDKGLIPLTYDESKSLSHSTECCHTLELSGLYYSLQIEIR